MRRLLLTGVLLAVLVPLSSISHAATMQPIVWNIVALGDSDTTGQGDPTGLGWVGRYARLLRQKLGLKVVVTILPRTERPAGAALRCDPTRRRAAW